MSRFFEAIKALLPRSRLFSLPVGSNIRGFFKGLSVLPEDVRRETDRVFLDAFPATTRAKDLWLDQFGLSFTENYFGDKWRDILDSQWKNMSGGQTAQYLERNLRQVSDEIRVYENNPAANPVGVQNIVQALCGHRSMVCGRGDAICNFSLGSIGESSVLPMGHKEAVCGGSKAMCGFVIGQKVFTPSVLMNKEAKRYDIPGEERWWQQCFYVGGEVIRNSAGQIVVCRPVQVEKKWREYFEYIILKIKPVQTIGLLFIEWV